MHGVYSVSKGSHKRDYNVLVRKGSILHKVGIINRLTTHTKTPHLTPIISHLKKHYDSSRVVIRSLKSANRIGVIFNRAAKLIRLLFN